MLVSLKLLLLEKGSMAVSPDLAPPKMGGAKGVLVPSYCLKPTCVFSNIKQFVYRFIWFKGRAPVFAPDLLPETDQENKINIK